MKKIEQTLLFLTLLLLPTQLGRHFWPDFSFIYSLRIDYLSPTIYFWDLLVLSLVSIRICSCFIMRYYNSRSQNLFESELFESEPQSRGPQSRRLAFLTDVKNVKIINWLALNLFLVFLLTQVISLLTAVSSANIGVGLVRFEQYLIAGFFGVYLASLNFEKSKKIFFWALSLAVLVESMLAIAQFLKAGTLGLWILGERTFTISTPAIAKFDFYGNQFLRPYATFPHPNVLAAFLVVVVPLLSLWRSSTSSSLSDLGVEDLRLRPEGPKADRILFQMLSLRSSMTTIAFILGSITLVLTVSRAAIAAAIISSFFILRRRWFIWILLVLVLVSPFLYPRFSSILNFDNLTVLRREELSKLALQMWSSAPFLGVGLNNFILSSASSLVVGPSRFLQPAHNIFLLSLAETGIIGVIGIIGLIGYPIYKLIKGKIDREKRKVLLLAWGLIIFLGMFDHYFLTLPQGYRLLFLIWGISMLKLNDGASS